MRQYKFGRKTGGQAAIVAFNRSGYSAEVPASAALRTVTVTFNVTAPDTTAAACGEISNRQLTLSYGADGMQLVNDTVLNWWSVSPCGE